MRNKRSVKTVSDAILQFIYWVPKLLAIQFIWLLFSLPCLTLGTATRAAICTLLEIQKSAEETIWQIFTRFFKFFFAQNKGYDLLRSSYFIFLLIDTLIFWQLNQPIFRVLMYAFILLLFLSMQFFIYQTLVFWQMEKRVSLFYAFYLFCRSFGMVMLHVLTTILFALFFMFFGTGYFLLIGVSGYFLLQLKIAQTALKHRQAIH